MPTLHGIVSSLDEAHDLLAKVNHTLENLENDNDALLNLLTEIREYISSQTQSKNIQSRIETVENAISQILLSLEDVDQYPDYMNFIVENFNNTNQIDTFSSDITSITQGNNSISVENISGMLPLSWYVISDGLTSERVQVSSININNGVNNVILTDPVENNYNLDNVKLYRTSALINTGSATSYGILLSKLWLANLIWRGLMSDETFSVENVVNATNYDLFTFTGQATFTDNNYFCLGDTSEDGVLEDFPHVTF